MPRTKYLDRILIPINGKKDIFFFTKSLLRIANGYEKVVIEKKPLLEFSPKNICRNNISIPFAQKWRENSENSQWIEYRSNDYCEIKIRYCKKKQKFYTSIFDLESMQNQKLIEPLIKERA